MSSSRPPRQRRIVRTPKPRAGWPWILVVVFATAGLATAIELQVVHLNAWTDPSAKSFCAINAEFNCDTVARSPYSVFLEVSVAVWGIVGYLLMAAAALWGWFSRGSRAAVASLSALSFTAVGVSLVLGTISKLTIQSICVLCLTTYVLNAGIATVAALLLRRAGVARSVDALRSFVNRNFRATALFTLGAAVAVLALIGLHPKYWDFTKSGAPLGGERLGLATPAASGAAGAQDGDVATGVTEDGHPWIGANDPKLTIVEFSDYQCPFCARGHQKLRALVEAHPQKLRLVHKNFPLDHTCNPIMREPLHDRACFYAGLAACAGEQGKFWAANDYLFIHGRDTDGIEAVRLAGELGLELEDLNDCLDKRAIGLIRADLEEGIRLKIDGTPSFVVNGALFPGEIPPEVLAPYIGP